MESCLIDGQVRDVRLESLDSLGGVLDSVSGEIARSGRFISSLRVNGREVADIGREEGRGLEGIRSIEITTDSSVCLATRIIGEAEEYINGLQNCLLQTAGCYTSGSDRADQFFRESVQGLEWLVQMIGFIEKTFNLDFGRLSHNGATVAHLVHSLNGIFQQIVESQEKCDPVLLADVLEYDLVPHLEEWKRVFVLFKEESALFTC